MTRGRKRFPRVSGRDLMLEALSEATGDLLDRLHIRHNGSPTRVDGNGLSKSRIYERAVAGDIEFFNAIAEDINDPIRRRHYLISQRTFDPKESGGFRPIDDPWEIRRLYAAFVRRFLETLVNDEQAIDKGVIAFRMLRDFPELAERCQGFAIQDAFAQEVHNLISTRGPWVVVVDLQDAFGQLPLKAVNGLLSDLGLNKVSRRIVLDVVKVRSRDRQGRWYETCDKGIEQGGILSPLIFNIVTSRVFKRLRNATGAGCASYGDDIVLVARTETKAQVAFREFQRITTELGFENVRGLDDGPKASKIINTEIEPVRLIRTFLVRKGEVGLTDEKAEDLRACAMRKDIKSVTALRKLCRYKTASKNFLQESILREVLSSTGTGRVHEGNLKDHQEIRRTEPGSNGMDGNAMRTEIQRAYPSRDNKTTNDRSRGGEASVSIYRDGDNTYGVSSKVVSRNVVFDTHKDSDPSHSESVKNLRKHRDCSLDGHPEPPVAGGKSEGAGDLACPLTSSVSQIADEDLRALMDRRRLRGGDDYRKKVVDVRPLIGLRQNNKLWALQQVSRKASHHGIAKLLVDPRDRVVFSPDGIGGRMDPHWKRIDVTVTPHEDGTGVVLKLRRRLPEPTPAPRAPTTPPSAPFVVWGISPSREHTRAVVVDIDDGEGRRRELVEGIGVNASVARLEGLAEILRKYRPTKIAVRHSPILGRMLLPIPHDSPSPDPPPEGHGHGYAGDRLRLVPLHKAMTEIKSWHWERRKGWIVGKIHQQSRRRRRAKSCTP